MTDLTTNDPADGLEAVLDTLSVWLDKHEIVVARDVLFLRKSMPAALWGGDDWRGFLDSAVEVGVRLVWVEVERCVLTDRGEQSDVLAVEDDRADDFEQLSSALSGVEERIAGLYVHWAYGGVLNSLILEAAWIEDYRDYQDLADELRREVEARSAMAERAEARERDQRAMNEMARELLAHPRYEACKNRNDREYLARQLFDTELSISGIVLQAETLDRMGGEPGEAGDGEPLPF